VIKCEDLADFKLRRDALLGELRPVGVMESMLAERMGRLSWRMLRAERMQNQATDCMIEEETLPLGRVATKKWSNNVKILEKLLMHKRRLESSFYRTMTKLKKLQIMRRIEWEASEEKSVAQSPADQVHNRDFVKQSHSKPHRNDVRSLLEEAYLNELRRGAAGNKANRTQFKDRAAVAGAAAGRGRDSFRLSTGENSGP
jgi:hypothetical protein